MTDFSEIYNALIKMLSRDGKYDFSKMNIEVYDDLSLKAEFPVDSTFIAQMSEMRQPSSTEKIIAPVREQWEALMPIQRAVELALKGIDPIAVGESGIDDNLLGSLIDGEKE